MPSDAEQYERTVRAYDQRYLAGAAETAPWQRMGRIKQVGRWGQGVQLECEQGWLEIAWFRADCLRVRSLAGPDDLKPPHSYMAPAADWPVVQFEMHQGKDALVLESASLRCRIATNPYRMGLELLDGRIFYIDADGPQWQATGGIRHRMRLHPDEWSHGLGEHDLRLNLRGQQVVLWNGARYSHINVPFYLGVQGALAYGILWDNTARALVDIGASVPDELVYEAQGGGLCYYVFAGDDVKTVLARLSDLTGRIDLPPMWGLGYQQAGANYYPQARVIEIAQIFRERQIPCDALHLSGEYMDDSRVFTWNAGHFPEPMTLLGRLHGTGFKVVIPLHNRIMVDSEYEPYKSGFFRDVFLKYPDGKTVAVPAANRMAHIPDFSKPAARTWWTEICQQWLEQGIDGIVIHSALDEGDAGSPGISLPDYVQYDHAAQGAAHQDIHNAYGLLMASACNNAVVGNKRRMQVSTAATAGSQRCSMVRMGRMASDWDVLRMVISKSLNLSLSGISLFGADIGGYYGGADAELFTRWLQAACLMPLFVADSARNTPPQEPWSFGQPYEVINRLTIQLRYRLLPYLYAVIAQCREYGWPVIRPIFMAEPDNPELYGIDDCYLVGDALLVAPALKPGMTRRSVYLPRGTWYDYWTGEALDGGMTVVAMAPLERLPLYVQAGSVLPMWPEMQYVGEKPLEKLVLRVYPGDAETILYEDAGEGLAYKQGAYRWVYLSCGWEDDTLTVDRRVAGQFAPAYNGISLEILGFDDEPAEVRVDRKGAPLWYYDDEVLELSLAEFRRVEVVRKDQDSDRTLPHKDR